MRRRDLVVLSAAFVLMLAATLPWIGHLGMEYDEAHFLPLAAKIAYGAEERIELPWGFTVGHRAIPFMTMPYVGTLDAFVYAAPYRLFGTGVAVSRGTNIALGLMILALAWWVAWREAGTWAAVGVLGLLVADVEWVLHVPTHFGPFLLQQLFALGAVAALQQWWRSGAKGWFFLAVAVLALAFHEKLTFIWILTSLSLGVVLFAGRVSWQRSRWWYYPAGLALAVVIVSPILYFAYAAPEVILGFGKASAKAPSDWSRVLAERWKVLDVMLRGHWTMEFTTGTVPESLFRGPALWLLFFGGLGASVVVRQPLALILYTTAAGVWAWNLVFPDAGRMHHALLMAPFWQAGAAIAVVSLPRVGRLVGLFLLLWAGWDAARCYTWYSGRVEQTGGINHWSDMTLRAMDWLEAHPSLDPVTTSWGLARQMTALSQGRLNLVEHDTDTLKEPMSTEAQAQLTELIRKERQVWLVSSVMPVYEEQWQRVVALGKQAGKQVYHLKTFPSRDGQYRIVAYTFSPPKVAPERWTAVAGPEFAVAAGEFRFELSGVADEDADSLSIRWLDAGGRLCWTDTRNFYWVPKIHDKARFEFTNGYWPASFTRMRVSDEKPVRVRIESNFKKARITAIEVPSP